MAGVRFVRRLEEDAIDHGTGVEQMKLDPIARQVFHAKSWTMIKFITGSSGVTFGTKQSSSQAGSGTVIPPDVLLDIGIVSPGTEFYASGPAGSTLDIVSTPLPWLNRLVKLIMRPDTFEGIVRGLTLKKPKLVVRLVTPKSMRKAG